jgi:hypothetical protein
VLLVEPLDTGSLSLFRLPLPFRGSGAATAVDVRYPGKAWEPVPQRSGADAAAFTDPGGALAERLRLRIGRMSAEDLAAALKQSARAPAPPAGSSKSAAAPSRGPVYKGRLTISANITGRGIQIVKFLLDGQVRAIDNVLPYEWEWDTRTSPNGEHTIEIQGLDLEGRLINTTTSHVTVAN